MVEKKSPPLARTEMGTVTLNIRMGVIVTITTVPILLRVNRTQATTTHPREQTLHSTAVVGVREPHSTRTKMEKDRPSVKSNIIMSYAEFVLLLLNSVAAGFVAAEFVAAEFVAAEGDAAEFVVNFVAAEVVPVS